MSKLRKISQDNAFRLLCLLAAGIAGVLMLGFMVQLAVDSSSAWREFGLGFIFSSEWDPWSNRYGALPSIVGTLVTTVIALTVALPLAFAAALFLTDAPPWLSQIIGNAIDLLAAIPSVIYGMWGLFVLAPIMQDYVQPFLIDDLGLGRIPFVGEYYMGFGLFTAGLILALMILPYMAAIMRDVFAMTPQVLREAAYGIGCTRWETAKDIVLKYGIRGLLGGVFIGLGRALGETMAVLFVVGNIMDMPQTLSDGGTTIASTLANNFSEADGLQRSALMALGIILFAMSFLIQIISHCYLSATKSKRGEAK